MRFLRIVLNIVLQIDGVSRMGVLGLSILADLPAFNIIDGFCVDSMHAVFEGAVRRTLLHLCKTSLSSESKRNVFDRRLLAVKVPAEVARTTRSVRDFYAGNWRVSEIHTVAFLTPILFHGLIAPDLLQHFVLLTVAAYHMHGQVIT